jgi:hypothetical protein
MTKSIILIGHVHDDKMAFENAIKISEIAKKEGLKTSIGLELNQDAFNEIKEQIKMKELRDQ